MHIYCNNLLSYKHYRLILNDWLVFSTPSLAVFQPVLFYTIILPLTNCSRHSLKKIKKISINIINRYRLDNAILIPYYTFNRDPVAEDHKNLDCASDSSPAGCWNFFYISHVSSELPELMHEIFSGANIFGARAAPERHISITKRSDTSITVIYHAMSLTAL